MTAWAAPGHVPARLRELGRTAASCTGLVALSLMVGLAQDGRHVRDVVAAVAAVGMVGIAARAPRLLLPATVVWLTALGLVRRLVTEFGPTARIDPLLAVGPLALVLLVLLAVRRGALASPTRLTKAVLAISALIVAGAANPLQGALFTGVSSLLFVLVPTFGFWIGRGLDERTIVSAFRLVAVLGVCVAVYGLLQTLSGFPSWDARWIGHTNLASLNVGGVIRPFASFSSAAEYAEYLAVAFVVWLGAASRFRLMSLSGVALAILIPALVLESSRGTIVIILVACGVMLGAWRGLPLLLAAAIGALLLAGLSYGLRSYASSTPTASTAPAALVSHEVKGLTNPFRSEDSTLTAHWSLILDGLRASLSNPIGRGTGAVTISGSTFGGQRFGTEADPSNMAVALGIPGLIAYLAVLVLGVRRVYGHARSRRDIASLVGLGIVVVTLLQWLNGGLYAVAFLPWLVLGWSDRPEPRPQ